MNPGHGLGLSVTKALLDLMEGKINIVSKRSQGSVFTVSIPQVEGAAHITGMQTFIIDPNDPMKDGFILR